MELTHSRELTESTKEKTQELIITHQEGITVHKNAQELERILKELCKLTRLHKKSQESARIQWNSQEVTRMYKKPQQSSRLCQIS